MLKTYIYIAKLRMETMLAYRFEVWTSMMMQALTMIAIGFFWNAAYGEQTAALGVTRESMLTYNVISTLMGSLYYMGVEDRIADAVKSGSIATDMIKPVNLFSIYLAEDIGNFVINLFRTTLPLFFVALLVFGVPAPASAVHFGLFLLSFVLGYGINWTFSAIFAMISFSAIDLGPAFSVKYHFVNLLSGAIIPMWFFPNWLRSAMNCLPFVHMFQTPLSIYIGKYSLSECVFPLAVQGVWFLLLTIAFLYAQKRATRRVLVQGG